MNSSIQISWKKKIRRDCLHYMSGAIIIRFFLDLTALIAPSITAWMIGDMADALLMLDMQNITSRFPLFIAALTINVLGVSLLQLLENLLLTVNGFSYNRYLVGRYLRLPLAQTQTYDYSAVVTRCEMDITNYYFHQIYRYTRPFVLFFYFLLLSIAIYKNQYPIGLVFLLSLAVLPIIRANHVGIKASKLNAEQAKYREERRATEHMLFNYRDFLREYGLIRFSLKKAGTLFQRYMERFGYETASLDAANGIVSLLCEYGIQIIIMIVGSIFIVFGKSTTGALLTCILLLPSITKACTFAAQWILAIRAEPEDQKRMEFFYGELEPEQKKGMTTVEELQFCDISFSYPGKSEPVLSNLNFSVLASGCTWLRGGNGSGKSTLLALLCGQYTPSGGQICNNGKPLSVSVLRDLTAYQEQDGAIFSTTIGDNLFAPSIPVEKQDQLLKAFGLQKPLDFKVAPQGANLSPGERKKILLCRALLKNAPFLVLDEPENHLDSAARAVLRQILRQCGKGIVLVSHQDSVFSIDELPITDVIDLHTSNS